MTHTRLLGAGADEDHEVSGQDHDAAGLFSLARELVAIPSVTGDEGALADFLARRLARLDLAVTEQTVDGTRRNILALGGPRARVLFCTHQDTVPPLLPVAEDDCFLYGRGACDAKGIMAVMIQTLAGLEPDRRAQCGLLFLVGEEMDSAGAVKANDLGVRPEFIVVGEPTENKLGLGHKGYVVVRVLVRGRKAHSGYPHLGESAVLKLIDVLRRLRELEFGEDRIMGRSTLNIGRVQGGVAANVVPDSAWAEISVRTTLPSRDILTKIRDAAAGEAEVEVLTASEPQTLFTLSGFETAVLSYSTDIPYLKVFGRPLLIGPGSILDAHTDRERISKSEMREAVGIYHRLVQRLLEGVAGGQP
jgi:acetylornithine deacetylase